MEATEQAVNIARLEERVKGIDEKIDNLIQEKRTDHKRLEDKIDRLAENLAGYSENLGNLLRLQQQVNTLDGRLEQAVTEVSKLKEEKNKFIGILIGIGVVLEALRWLAGELFTKFFQS